MTNHKTDMTISRHKNTIALLCFFWVGFVSAISFMEAWLKFQAPGVTRPIGLSIGQLVFNALNKVEITLSILLIYFSLRSGIRSYFNNFHFLLIVFVILSLQSCWLLPALNQRAELIISGNMPPASNSHLFYVTLELLKVICLSANGLKLLNNKKWK